MVALFTGMGKIGEKNGAGMGGEEGELFYFFVKFEVSSYTSVQ